MDISDSINKEPAFDRLLQVAVEVFAEYGFRAATVRDICRRANVNVASVNYYFRSKEALYAKALAFAFMQANQRYPLNRALDENLPPEQRLKLFIENFLNKLLDDSHLGFHSKLITREITEPTRALDEIIETAIVPNCALLEEIIRQILGLKANAASIHRCVLSVLGQCLMYKHSRSVVERLYPQLISDQSAIQLSADHIAQFSVFALNQLALQNERQPQ
jgi:TetR/AcrR family transcriptional regulator, regulator of cefoperazone and chloramphenicol sensitivity